jgi:integrase
VYALRFRAYGERRYVTLGAAFDGWDLRRAEAELANVLADVRRGIWRPSQPEAVIEPKEEPTFHEFASEWVEARKHEGLRDRTIEDYTWCLSCHLLPFFARHRLSDITVREVDLYSVSKARERQEIEQAHARGERLDERGLSNGSINHTLTLLSQVLGTAVEYELIPANPATGKRRRLKASKPRRPWVEPEQLPTFLDAAVGFTDAEKAQGPLLAGRGRPLLATLAGAGLRIGEALALERQHVNLAKGTLTVAESKTDAGVRTVDLIPALRDELAVWLDAMPFKRPNDLVFPTLKGKRDNRHNVRQRLVLPAIERTNERLAKLGIDPIGKVTPHGLRRTFATLRCAVGDDPAYTASQLGHEDAGFTLRVYTLAVKRRERLVGAERAEFERAIEWAQWARTGTSNVVRLPSVASPENVRAAEAAS